MTSDATDLQAEAIRTLSAAARCKRADGTSCDFAAFLARVLTSTAANLGGCENLLAGRPGSLEADLVRSLIDGTLGDRAVNALRYRTEPLVVTLNIAELIDDTYLHPDLMGLDDALLACEERSDQTDDDQLDTCKQELAAIAARYVDEFALYAEGFTAVVLAAAPEIWGLAVPVRVDVQADPSSPCWSDDILNNTDDWDLDEVVRLWNIAHDTVPLPNVDIGPALVGRHHAE